MLRSSRLVPALALALGIATALPARAVEVVDLPVKSRVIENFRIGSDQTVFGPLEFIGGLEMTSSQMLFGAVSAIRFRPDRAHFVAIMDTGHWLTGRVTRDAAGRLSGVADLQATSMIDDKGRDNAPKWAMDVEGLALRPGEVIASYEGRARVDVYPDPGFEQSKPVERLKLAMPVARLPDNRGLETLALAPADSPLAGALVTVSELGRDGKGNLMAEVLEGPRKGVFAVKERKPFAITDGAFLPNGDLLLLERRFSFAEGVGMEIRRIPGDTIKPGAVVDGEVILAADMRSQIDNMEGLDVVTMPDGAIHIILVSDDNHSILQRNLMLEFRLRD